MKKLLFIAALLASMVNNTFAQYYGVNASEKSCFVHVYGRFNYASLKETVNGSSISISPMFGGTIGGVLSPNLTINTMDRRPLFLEVGAEFSYMYGKTTDRINVNGRNAVPVGDSNIQLTDEDGNEYPSTVLNGAEKATLNMVYANVPVTLTYDLINISKGQVIIAPLIGVDFRFNIMSKLTMFSGGEGGEISYSKIKDEDVNIFQFGAHVGFNVILVHGFTVGYRFNPDIMHYAKNTTTMTHSLQLGYRF